MALIFLDAQWQVISQPIDDVRSIIVTDRWSSFGEFTAAIDKSKFNLARTASYVYDQDTATTAIIEAIDSSNQLTISGRQINALFDNIVIYDKENVSGVLELEVRNLVTKYAINGDQAIPGLELEPLHQYFRGISTTAACVNLADFLYSELDRYGMSWRLDYDFLTNKIYFRLLFSLDRTQAQNTNTWAVFSTSRNNIGSINYNKDIKELKNFAYVSGTKKDGSYAVYEVDQTNGDAQRSVAVATNIKQDDDDNDAFVVVGNGGKIAVSTDSLNFSNKTSGTTENLLGVDHQNGNYIACGENHIIAISENGTDWETKDSLMTDVSLRKTLYYDGIYLCAGNGIFYSHDGDVWALAYVPIIAPDIRCLVRGADRFICIDVHGVVLESMDGTSWTKRATIPDSVISTVYDLIYARGLYVVVGSGGGIATSRDAITWTKRTSGTTSTLRAIAYGSRYYVAVGDGGVIVTSVGGGTWTTRNSDVTTRLNGVAYGMGRFLAVGTGFMTRSYGISAWGMESNPLGVTCNSITYGTSRLDALLRQKGIETLAKYKSSETMTAEIETNSPPIEGVDYNLGDIVDVVDVDKQLTASIRVTEIERVYEPEGIHIKPRFGDDMINLKKYIKREIGR